MALTKAAKKKEVLDFIAGFVDENGYCPSYEEIARGLNLASLATVHKHISVLEAKTYLKRGFNQSRSLETCAPIYGRSNIAPRRRPARFRCWDASLRALPVEAVEQQETLNFADFAGKTATPSPWKSRGNSMIDDHICDGDNDSAGGAWDRRATAIS